MIIEFSIKNYRSVNNKQSFSMIASGARSKSENTFNIELANGTEIKLIKTAGIFGANASGKSNIIRAFFELKKCIIESSNIDIDKPIPAYDPFLFNTESINQPTEFELIFITKARNKFKYKLVLGKDEILEETLHHFPSKQAQIVFKRGIERKKEDSNIHIGELGKNFNYKRIEIFKKLPLISYFGKAENYHTTISPVYSYFNELEVWNVTESNWVRRLSNHIKTTMQNSENKSLANQIEKIILSADTQIQSLIIDSEKLVNEADVISIDGKQNIRIRKNEILFGEHNIYKSNKKVSTYALPFMEESFGTNKLFALSGLIVKTINNGGVIFFDELDSSLHPFLTELLIKYFQSNQKNNSQLIFTTHETFIQKDLRTDQIWFAQKNQFGETELFSAQDFDGVREDIPFEKWYLGGKFGAIPYVKE